MFLLYHGSTVYLLVFWDARSVPLGITSSPKVSSSLPPNQAKPGPWPKPNLQDSQLGAHLQTAPVPLNKAEKLTCCPRAASQQAGHERGPRWALFPHPSTSDIQEFREGKVSWHVSPWPIKQPGEEEEEGWSAHRGKRRC